MTERITEKDLYDLDIDNLRSMLKEKCRTIQNLDDQTKGLTTNFSNLLKEEKDKNDEIRAIIRLQKIEREQNTKYKNEIQKELALLKEKTTTKRFEIPKGKNQSKFLLSTDLKEIELQKKDFKDDKKLKPVSSSSSKIENIENNEVSIKWPSHEKQIAFNFQELEIKFKKVDDLINTKANAMLKKEFKFVDIEIYNTTDSVLIVDDFCLNSTAGKL